MLTPEEVAEKAQKRKIKQTERHRREARRELDAEERGTTDAPVPMTLTALLAEPDEATPWRITGCQPKHTRVIVAAQFKAGKTTLVGNLIRSLRDGDPFLGKYAVTRVTGTIALLDFEMGTHQLKRWYHDLNIGDTDRVIVFALRGKAASFNLADPQVRAQWVQCLRELGVTYLIIDCLRPILDALGLVNRTGIVGGLIPREDGAHGTTQQVLPRTT